MGDRNKRIFISDIHLGDEESMSDPNHYGWFKKNVSVLAKFLEDQLGATDVKEMVILGDLFDTWIIPSDKAPLTSFDAICSNGANKPIIDGLKALAASPVKLAYVPGNHDMGMNTVGISDTRKFMEEHFPGIRYLCNDVVPLGSYNAGTLAAEHGNRYCLFNAPDTWTAPDTFLPLGYFISRIVAYKVLKTGHEGDPRDIFINVLKEFVEHPDFIIEDLFYAVAKDAKLSLGDTIQMIRVPGYTVTTTVEEAGRRFRNLTRDWEQIPGNSEALRAAMNDYENLSSAADRAYFSSSSSNINIVIFGHTHIPDIIKKGESDAQSGDIGVPRENPCDCIYANSGTWVDLGKYGCTYVETEEVADERRHYVRLKKYPGNASIDEAFVSM